MVLTRHWDSALLGSSEPRFRRAARAYPSLLTGVQCAQPKKKKKNEEVHSVIWRSGDNANSPGFTECSAAALARSFEQLPLRAEHHRQ